MNSSHEYAYGPPTQTDPVSIDGGYVYLYRVDMLRADGSARTAKYFAHASSARKKAAHWASDGHRVRLVRATVASWEVVS